MGKTKITDVIIPELFAPYVIYQTKELSSIINSGIAVSNPALDDLVTKGGKLINMPFWKPLTGDDEVVSDGDALTPEKITAIRFVLLRHNVAEKRESGRITIRTGGNRVQRENQDDKR